MKRLSYLWDILALAGASAIIIGLWIAHPSLALTIGGAAAVFVAIVGAKRCS